MRSLTSPVRPLPELPPLPEANQHDTVLPAAVSPLTVDPGGSPTGQYRIGAERFDTAEAWWEAVSQSPAAWDWVERSWRDGQLVQSAFAGEIPEALKSISEQLAGTRAHDGLLGRLCVARIVDQLSPSCVPVWAGHRLDAQGLTQWVAELIGHQDRESPAFMRLMNDWRQVWDSQFLRQRVELGLREREGVRGAWARSMLPWLARRDQWVGQCEAGRAKVWREACLWLGADDSGADEANPGTTHPLKLNETSAEWPFVLWLGHECGLIPLAQTQAGLAQAWQRDAGQMPEGSQEWDTPTWVWVQVLWPMAVEAVKKHQRSRSEGLSDFWRRGMALSEQSGVLLDRWVALSQLRWPPYRAHAQVEEVWDGWSECSGKVALLERDLRAEQARRETPVAPSSWGPVPEAWRLAPLSPLMSRVLAWTQGWQRMHVEVRQRGAATEGILVAEAWRNRCFAAPAFLAMMALWCMLALTMGHGLWWLPVLVTGHQLVAQWPRWSAYEVWRKKMAESLPSWQQRAVLS